MRTTRRRWPWVAGGLGALVLAIGAYAAFYRPTVVLDPSLLARVRRADLAKVVVATGTIQPLRMVDVKSKASGLIEKLNYDYGDRVRAGAVLAELDRRQLRDRVRQLAADLAGARANLAQAQATYERDRVEARGVELPYLLRDQQRAQGMFHDGLIARAQLDDAERAYELALNQQQQAAATVPVGRAGVQQARAQVVSAQAQLESAREDLAYAVIRAPISGEVLSRDVQVGDAVSSILVMGSTATKIMTLGDMSRTFVRGKVDESDIGQVHIGQPVQVKVDAYPKRSFAGRVIRIAPLGVTKKNVTTFLVKVAVDNPGELLRPGMSANAEIVQERRHNVLVIPEGAVIYGKAHRTYVEVPDPSAPKGQRRIPVELGISNGAQTEVVSGLKDGEPVVLQ